jgi:hypothetical protein
MIFFKDIDSGYWKDQKGRKVKISTMSDKWLNNIRKKIKDKELKQPIIDEIKRRMLKRKRTI